MTEQVISESMRAFTRDVRRWREESGLSLQAISRRTMVHVDTLAGFERTGHYNNPTFNIVYLRLLASAYAECVGLDVGAMRRAMDQAYDDTYDGALGSLLMRVHSQAAPGAEPAPLQDSKGMVSADESTSADEPAEASPVRAPAESTGVQSAVEATAAPGSAKATPVSRATKVTATMRGGEAAAEPPTEAGMQAKAAQGKASARTHQPEESRVAESKVSAASAKAREHASVRALRARTSRRRYPRYRRRRTSSMAAVVTGGVIVVVVLAAIVAYFILRPRLGLERISGAALPVVPEPVEALFEIEPAWTLPESFYVVIQAAYGKVEGVSVTLDGTDRRRCWIEQGAAKAILINDSLRIQSQLYKLRVFVGAYEVPVDASQSSFVLRRSQVEGADLPAAQLNVAPDTVISLQAC